MIPHRVAAFESGQYQVHAGILIKIGGFQIIRLLLVGVPGTERASAPRTETTPTKFDVISAGESHPQLPHPIKDAVLMSADTRYLKLVERVKENFGRIDADAARDLMKLPVAMTSNIHSVLFAP